MQQEHSTFKSTLGLLSQQSDQTEHEEPLMSKKLKFTYSSNCDNSAAIIDKKNYPVEYCYIVLTGTLSIKNRHALHLHSFLSEGQSMSPAFLDDCSLHKVRHKGSLNSTNIYSCD